MPRLLAPLALAAALVSAGCSPALDWREFQPEGSGIVATFPCKPDRHTRTVKLAVQTVRFELISCAADDAQFALDEAESNDLLWYDVTEIPDLV